MESFRFLIAEALLVIFRFWYNIFSPSRGYPYQYQYLPVVLELLK